MTSTMRFAVLVFSWFLGFSTIDFSEVITTTAPSVDPEIQDLVDSMRAQDVDKATTSQYTLNWGEELANNPKPSGKDLLSNIDESLFKTAVYEVLKRVFDNGIFNPNVCVTETDYNSGFKRFVVQELMHDYLVKKDKIPSDLTQFKQFLTTFWFGTYTRCTDNTTIGSSGFEHVFSGEWKGAIVDGHHNWMKYYLNQKSGDIKYYGYYHYQGQLAGTFEYDWAGLNKETGGMLFGTSPVFDFSLFTACSLTYSGERACRFSIDGVPLAVSSFTKACATGELCLSTAYPEDGFS